MPRRNDIKNILIIGSGPIAIGQGCEFDYSGVQACKALKEEGFRVILVNSNPATVMTDPQIADATYIEPLNCETLERIIDHESIDGILTTMGGQTAINLSLELHEKGVLERYGAVLIGADKNVIMRAEDRSEFYKLLKQNSIDVPGAFSVMSVRAAEEAGEKIGYPLLIRSSFSLGGKGVFLVNSREELNHTSVEFFSQHPNGSLLIEESALNWKEFELEVVRDSNDNCILVCSIENCDPMGVHTGDSITVAPALTLTDKQLQKMRSMAFKVMRLVGVETGGANVQFAVNPSTGRTVVIEMNPRVSRSSALASKATGFPIARVAAKLAAGYHLDELKNEVTGSTPASFEPSIDYVVTKIPRFDFSKFPEANTTLSTTMKSVGEVMGVGKNFEESLQKAISSLEKGFESLQSQLVNSDSELKKQLEHPSEHRVFHIAEAIRSGMDVVDICKLTGWDKWFIERIANIISIENELRISAGNITQEFSLLRKAKAYGFSDAAISELTDITLTHIRSALKNHQITPVFRRIDSCAGEFSSVTNYLYSTYHHHESSVTSCECFPSACKKVIVIGSGPNHIGQGIEFDYSCVQASLAIRESGLEAIIINCNPETVSTDHTVSDKLYFAPITEEHVLNIIEAESQKGQVLGVIIQCGGQASLKIAKCLRNNSIPILGTGFESIELAEDRNHCRNLINRLGLLQPPNCICNSSEDFMAATEQFDGPIIVRPSHVIGGDKMEIIDANESSLLERKFTAYKDKLPILVEAFLSGAVELDVDLICDGEDVYIAGIMEHFEPAGVHSGDSRSILPTQSIGNEIYDRIVEAAERIAISLQTIGFMNIQFAIHQGNIYVIEVNPRASRTLPFLCKATGNDLAKIGTEIILGKKIREFASKLRETSCDTVCIKSPVFSHDSLECSPITLSPNMKSTGEAMWIGTSANEAYRKGYQSAFDLAFNLSSYVAIDIDEKHADLKVKITQGLALRGKHTIVYDHQTDHDDFLRKVNVDMEQGRCMMYLSANADTFRYFKLYKGVFITTSFMELKLIEELLRTHRANVKLFPLQSLNSFMEDAA